MVLAKLGDMRKRAQFEALDAPWRLAMRGRSVEAPLPPLGDKRPALLTALLVGAAVLLVTQDASGASPYILLGLALCVAVHGYLHARPKRPWECNDEPC